MLEKAVLILLLEESESSHCVGVGEGEFDFGELGCKRSLKSYGVYKFLFIGGDADGERDCIDFREVGEFFKISARS